MSDGKLQNTVSTYDALDRTHVITYADSSVITNTYDLDGNLTTLMDNTGTTLFVYDLLNRQVAKSLPGQGTAACPGTTTITGTLCYTFDTASNLTAFTDTTASNSVSCNGLTVSTCYGYNTLNELTSLVDPANKTTTFGYDANHHRTTTTYPGNTVQTATYDNAQRLTAITAVNGTNTLTNYSYSYTNPATTTDTMRIFTGSQSDSFSHTATITNTYDVLNHLTEWQFTKGTGSVLNNHDYVYHYDGNGNRTYIMPDTTTNETNLFYNAANEWYQSTDHVGNVNVISWDAAGNLLGNNGFGGSHPLTVTYNAKEQTATQTDTAQHVSPMTFTGRGQFERVADTDTNGTHSYTYSALGLTKIVSSTATYVRDPNGGLVSQQNVTGGPYYYLCDRRGPLQGWRMRVGARRRATSTAQRVTLPKHHGARTRSSTRTDSTALTTTPASSLTGWAGSSSMPTRATPLALTFRPIKSNRICSPTNNSERTCPLC